MILCLSITVKSVFTPFKKGGAYIIRVCANLKCLLINQRKRAWLLIWSFYLLKCFLKKGLKNLNLSKCELLLIKEILDI
jgi:hypothetical protein